MRRNPHEDGFSWAEIRETVFEMYADDGYYGRAILAYQRWNPQRNGSLVRSIMAVVQDQLEDLVERNRYEAEEILMDEWEDNEAYNKSPNAYYGVSP